MKRKFLSKGPPFSPEEIEAIVAAAPAYVYDPDDSYDPNNEEEVNAFWSKAKHVIPDKHRFQQNEIGRENLLRPYFTKEEIEAAIAAAPDYVYDPDCPYNPDNEDDVDAYWSRGIVTFPGGHPHQDPQWKIHGKRHPVIPTEKDKTKE